MRLGWFIFVAFLMTAVSAGADTLALPPTGKLNRSDQALAKKAWSKLKRALPGLDAYAQDLTVAETVKGPGAKGITFEVVVAEKPRKIPSVFLAADHHCFLDVDSKLKKVTISKRACVSVATQMNAFEPALSKSLNGGPLILDID